MKSTAICRVGKLKFLACVIAIILLACLVILGILAQTYYPVLARRGDVTPTAPALSMPVNTPTTQPTTTVPATTPTSTPTVTTPVMTLPTLPPEPTLPSLSVPGI